MTKTFTNHANTDCPTVSLTEDMVCVNELNVREKRLYSIISSQLNKIQVHPKEETVLKIIAYSKTKNNSSI